MLDKNTVTDYVTALAIGVPFLPSINASSKSSPFVQGVFPFFKVLVPVVIPQPRFDFVVQATFSCGQHPAYTGEYVVRRKS